MTGGGHAILRSHRCAVLHHGVVELVALGCASREEAALAHVVVEMLQTAIPTHEEIGRKKSDTKSDISKGDNSRSETINYT